MIPLEACNTSMSQKEDETEVKPDSMADDLIKIAVVSVGIGVFIPLS